MCFVLRSSRAFNAIVDKVREDRNRDRKRCKFNKTCPRPRRSVSNRNFSTFVESPTDFPISKLRVPLHVNFKVKAREKLGQDKTRRSFANAERNSGRCLEQRGGFRASFTPPRLASTSSSLLCFANSSPGRSFAQTAQKCYASFDFETANFFLPANILVDTVARIVWRGNWRKYRSRSTVPDDAETSGIGSYGSISRLSFYRSRAP